MVQRRTGDGWERVAEGRLRKSGRYRIAVQDTGLYRVIAAGDPGPSVRVR